MSFLASLSLSLAQLVVGGGVVASVQTVIVCRLLGGSLGVRRAGLIDPLLSFLRRAKITLSLSALLLFSAASVGRADFELSPSRKGREEACTTN